MSTEKSNQLQVIMITDFDYPNSETLITNQYHPEHKRLYPNRLAVNCCLPVLDTETAHF